MQMDPVLFVIAGVAGVALLLAYLLRALGAPVAAAYILTGAIVGPSGLGLIHDAELLRHVGELGVIMLMFFIGMEMDLPRLVAGWRVAVVGTLAQVAASVAVCIAGAWLAGWDWRTGLLSGFMLSLSSTAVVLTLLKDTGELESGFGQNVLGVLLMQDLLVVPMLFVIGAVSGDGASPARLVMQVGGGAALVALAVWLARGVRWRIPEGLAATEDKRILLGLLVCFASAALTSAMGLSAAFGAFLAGLALHDSNLAGWVKDHLRSVYVVFVAVFFLSVGALVDVRFVAAHPGLVLVAVVGVFALNSGLNTLVLRALGERWTMAMLTGGLLSQIGELAFLLASVGLERGLLSPELHQLAVVVIALTLLASPLWVWLVRRLVQPDTVVMRDAEMQARVEALAEELRLQKGTG